MKSRMLSGFKHKKTRYGWIPQRVFSNYRKFLLLHESATIGELAQVEGNGVSAVLSHREVFAALYQVAVLTAEVDVPAVV